MAEKRKHDTTRERLTAAEVKRLIAAGPADGKSSATVHDGGGLFLRIGAKRDSQPAPASWFMRYMLRGMARDLGLGSARDVSLAKAREIARANRERIKGDKVDPLAEREATEAAQRLAAARGTTFEALAQDYISRHSAAWKNEKHIAQWTATLETYAYPIIGKLPVSAITIDDVLKVLEPIWTTKPETASRVRGRLENIFDAAIARKMRAEENPARLRLLKPLLAKQSKVRKVAHHAALPVKEIPAFMAKLQGQEGLAAAALRFTILTAARTGETIGALGPEINASEAIWTVPGERYKTGKPHRVPLSKQALAIVKGQTNDGGLIFPLSNMAMLQLLKRMDYGHVTVHGFRSTFDDWAIEAGFARHIVDRALGHAIADKAEAAYRRSDLIEQRRELMQAWAKFCEAKS